MHAFPPLLEKVVIYCISLTSLASRELSGNKNRLKVFYVTPKTQFLPLFPPILARMMPERQRAGGKTHPVTLKAIYYHFNQLRAFPASLMEITPLHMAM